MRGSPGKRLGLRRDNLIPGAGHEWTGSPEDHECSALVDLLVIKPAALHRRPSSEKLLDAVVHGAGLAEDSWPPQGDPSLGAPITGDGRPVVAVPLNPAPPHPAE